MIELIQALEALLERGIVIEPVNAYVEHQRNGGKTIDVETILTGAYRIRLDEAHQPQKDPGAIPAEPQQMRGW